MSYDKNIYSNNVEPRGDEGFDAPQRSDYQPSTYSNNVESQDGGFDSPQRSRYQSFIPRSGKYPSTKTSSGARNSRGRGAPPRGRVYDNRRPATAAFSDGADQRFNGRDAAPIEHNFFPSIDDEGSMNRDAFVNGADDVTLNPNHKKIYMSHLRDKSLEELMQIAKERGIVDINRMPKKNIICTILCQAAHCNEAIYGDGVLEFVGENFGFLRSMVYNYVNSPDDIYVSQNQIKKFNLCNGDIITGQVKAPNRGEHYFSLAKIDTINDHPLDEVNNKINFVDLVPLYPKEKFNLDVSNVRNGNQDYSTRIIDLISPIGKGQRALIVAPPKSGKTILMQNIAHAINVNHPEVYLIVLLIDERPEEVTDMLMSIKGEVVSSTFDESASRHIALAEIVLAKAKRQTEEGKDVVILLDNLTRLARAYNAAIPSSGKVLTGGVDSSALQRPKRFLGAARNTRNGGSLTIIATALVDTGSRMDEVIFEEFKGTGNSEIVLDRKLSDRRMFPAINVIKSGTRREEEMVDKKTSLRLSMLHRILVLKAGESSNNIGAMEFLLKNVKESENNATFLDSMNS